MEYNRPPGRKVPRYNSDNGSKRSCCLRCLCCCACFLLVLIIILAAFLIYFFAFLKPKIPMNNVTGFEVHSFNMQPDFSLFTEFAVTVKANNPNAHIGFNYGRGSSVVITYSDSTLCSGRLPAYYQPSKNVTMMQLVLTGKSEFGSGLQEAFMDQKSKGEIPLLVMVKAPVAVVLHNNVPLREMVVYINCSLVVDNLAPNKKVRILSSKYNYSVKL